MGLLEGLTMPKFDENAPFQVVRILTYTGDKLAILRELSKRGIKGQHSKGGLVSSAAGDFTISEAFNDGDHILRMLGELVDEEGVAHKVIEE
jgi:hypothetical protein